MKPVVYLLATSIMLLCTINGLHAQNEWFKKIAIRQSFEGDESKQNPAVISITLPKDKASSYLIDLGIRYPIASDAKGLKTGSLITEYHYTNLTDEEINNFQIGYKHIWIFKGPSVGLPMPGALPSYRTGRLNSTFKFRNDNIERSRGAAGSFTLSFFQQGNSYKTWWNATKFSNSQRFHYTLSPEAGVEWQENFSADSTIHKGFFVRPLARMAIGFGQSRPNPASNLPDGIWLFNIEATARYDLIGKQYTNSRFHPLIKTSLDFFLLYKPVKLILGGSFVYGDNPIEGFREIKFKPQQFWVIAFKVQK